MSACPSPLIQLRTLFARSIPLLVQVESQISNVYASGALLARFKSGDGQLDVSCQHLALEYERCEVREVVSAYLVERDNRHAVVLRHQNKGCVHARASRCSEFGCVLLG